MKLWSESQDRQVDRQAEIAKARTRKRQMWDLTRELGEDELMHGYGADADAIPAEDDNE